MQQQQSQKKQPGTTNAQAILAVDVGNTITRVGILTFQNNPSTQKCEPVLRGSCELSTPSRLTADDARIQLEQARSLLPADALIGSILSCVVPTLAQPWRDALAHASSSRPLVVGPGLKSGMRMRFDDPSEVGADRVADAVAARHTYQAPVVVVDLGTTTNLEIIDKSGAFIGGVIAPGIELGARSLSQAAARLPEIELLAPREVIGRNTQAAMRSGVVLGEAARVDGLLDAVIAEMGNNDENNDEVTIVMTGTHAHEMARLVRHNVVVDETLILRGLALLWKNNQPKRKEDTCQSSPQ